MEMPLGSSYETPAATADASCVPPTTSAALSHKTKKTASKILCFFYKVHISKEIVGA